MTHPRWRVLGVELNALTISDLHEIIGETVERDGRCVIASQNLHSVYLHHHDLAMQEFYRSAHYMRIDGMSLVLLARLLGYPLERVHRVTWVDWLHPLMRAASDNGWRVYYLGSRPGVAEEGAANLIREFPRLQLRTHHGYFDLATNSPANNAVRDDINAFRPHVLMVGMGMPRQESWILSNAHRLDVNVILPCGACIDYVAGIIPTPPRWMGRIGLEWLFRLVSEPRRLFRRYMIEPWFVVGLFLREFFRKRILRRSQ